MGAVGIILARAGSKGLPSKNTRLVAGRACVEWTIAHARASRSLDHVCLTTDCPIAADIARHLGVQVIDRPDDLASDRATVDAAARHALDSLDDGFDRIALLYANVPVRPDDLTDRAMALLDESGADSVQSFVPAGKHHPLWTCVVGDDARLRAYSGTTLFANTFRRQDLPPAYHPDGGVTALRREALLLRRTDDPDGPHAFLGTDRRAVLTAPGEVVDIDDEIDLLVADATLRARVGAGAGA